MTLDSLAAGRGVRCLRWNLSPLEERWEAIEQCERLFGDTQLRALIAGGAAASLALGGSAYALWLALDAVVHGSKDSVVARVPRELVR